MKTWIIAVMDGLAAIVEHRLFGLAVWVWIAVCTAIEYQVGMAIGVTLKTYLSGTWVKKGNGNKNESETENANKNPTGGSGAGDVPAGPAGNP